MSDEQLDFDPTELAGEKNESILNIEVLIVERSRILKDLENQFNNLKEDSLNPDSVKNKEISLEILQKELELNKRIIEDLNNLKVHLENSLSKLKTFNSGVEKAIAEFKLGK